MKRRTVLRSKASAVTQEMLDGELFQRYSYYCSSDYNGGKFMDGFSVEKLQKFGLTLYEAKAYMALLKIGTANAYAICKESGIPRARIYDVLESILNRGLAMLEESSENTKTYTPVPSSVFLERVRGEWQSDYEDVKVHLQELEAQEKRDEIYVLTVKGKENILAYCRQLLKEARHHIVLSVWENMYGLLLPELSQCQDRGCRIVGIGHEIVHPMDGIELHSSNKLHMNEEGRPWFVLSVDSEKMIYGYSAETERDAFYTEDSAHVYLMEEYVLHDIIIHRLIKEDALKSRLSSMMEDLLDEIRG